MFLNSSLILILFSAIIFFKNIYDLNLQAEKYLEKKILLSAAAVSNALWNFDSEYINEFADALIFDSQTAYLKISSNGTTITEKTNKDFISKDFGFFKSSSRFISKEKTIFHKNFEIGKLQISIPKKTAYDSMINILNSTFIIVVLIISSILLSAVFIADKLIFRKIEHIQKGMEKILIGDFNIKLYTGSDDELGLLSKKIDNTVKDLKKITDIKNELNNQIEERKKIELSLRESEERFREFVENTDNLFIRLDAKGKIIYANPVAEKIYGKKLSELYGRKLIDFIHKDDLKYSVDWFNEAVKSKKSKSYLENRQINLSTGEISDWLWSAKFFYKNGVLSGLNCIGHDVTKLNSAEKERAFLEAKLFQSQKIESIGTLAGGIAHDFNNILGIIMGNAELAMQYIKNDTKALKKINEIIAGANRAKEVVAQLLNFSRKTELKKIVIKPEILVRESAKFLRASIESSIEIEILISPFIRSITAEPTQIHQIIINLCTNAANAMPDKKGKITIEIKNIDINNSHKYPDLPNGKYIELIVSDTGTGIPEDIINKVFEPYFTTKPFGKGSGLGLAVIHGIVKSHNGAIHILSEENKGTSVSIALPSNEPSEYPAAEQTFPVKGEGTILLVDDEKALAIITAEFLRSIGYNVVFFTTPHEAISYFENFKNDIDLVVTDMTMPGMYGNELAKRICEIKGSTPVILCTGFSDKLENEKSEEPWISAYLEKPIDNKYFARVIKKLLD